MSFLQRIGRLLQISVLKLLDISRLLALNYKNIRSTIILSVVVLLFFSACTPAHKSEVDELNERAYSFHYRNIDSTKQLATRALALSEDYDEGNAEALNNLAFVSIIRMRYVEAYKLLYKAIDVTDNQVELLISDIQL